MLRLHTPPTLRVSLLSSLPAAVLFGALLALGGVGCNSTPQDRPANRSQEESQLLEPNSFKAAWTRDIPGRYGWVDEMYLRDDMLFVYTNRNAVFAISATGGSTLWVSREVVGPRDRLWPPLLLDAMGHFGEQVSRIVAFPTNTAYVVYSDGGERLQETSLEQGERAITSPSYGYEGLAYVGLADAFGGRAASVDPKRLVNPIQKPRLLRGTIIAQPVVYDGIFFVADQLGSVYAIAEDGDQQWDIQRFETGGAISATLMADEHGVYVPSSDSVFYVLDRETGRMKWRYFAEVALSRPAFPTQDHVFLPVANRGVVALSKAEGATINREPVWVAEDAREVLSHDEQNVYLLHADGHIVAHRKTTGEELFRTQQRGFRSFARNLDGPRIYAATRGGRIIAIDPVLSRGQVGRMVMQDLRPDTPALAAAQ